MSRPIPSDRHVELRRDLHRHPEPAWCEFYTTARIVEEIERIGVAGQGPAAGQTESGPVDDLFLGPDALSSERRMAVPDDEELDRWFQRARDAGAREDVLDRLEGGYTGAVAVVERGEGPTVALRVDIDALPRAEASDDAHVPAAEGFHSENEGYMHACGHDAHATIGVGVLEAIAESEFEGTFKLLFQPGEEMIAGGEAMAKSGHLDDVDYLLAVHVGLDHPTGEVVAGVDGFLAVNHFEATFEGAPAHAGGKPNEGRNAVQAMAAAVQNLYAIPRHEDGATRINAGKVSGGTASNIVPEQARIEGEVRGETTELKEYMKQNAERVLENAAATYDCDLSLATDGEAPSAVSDPELADVVSAVSSEVAGVEQVTEEDSLGGSEDATYLMQEVQANGGLATYVCVGTDHPGGHHTATFDVDEATIPIGVDVLSESVLRIADERP